MKILFKILICACLAFISSVAFSDSGWTSSSNIEEVRTATTGKIVIQLPVDDTPSDCKEKNIYFFSAGPTTNKYLFDLILHAFINNLPVKVYHTGICELYGYSEISKVALVRKK